MTTTPKHPMGALVLGMFCLDRPAHDVDTISVALSGANALFGLDEHGSHAAELCYRTVARDVLGCLESDGYLTRGADGWLRLVESGGQP